MAQQNTETVGQGYGCNYVDGHHSGTCPYVDENHTDLCPFVDDNQDGAAVRSLFFLYIGNPKEFPIIEKAAAFAAACAKFPLCQ